VNEVTRVVDLALQGGGSHGAFTWGVLDALLEGGQLQFEGVTGTSAGAMNAVVMADGWARGIAARRDPRESARERLKLFWDTIAAQPSPFSAAPNFQGFPGLPGVGWTVPPSVRDAMAFNPMALWFDLLSRLFSPYQLNPLNYNPLATVLTPLIDFERLRAGAPFKLFVCATNVRTGRARVFREHELRLEMLLASACLPFTFHAVEVDGAHYWDGGYMGNPALFPLFYATQTRDIVLVQINPLMRNEVPDTSQEIIERVNEISFNSSLMQEMRSIAFVQRLLKENRLDPARYKQILMHMIAAEDRMRAYGASSKSNTSPAFIRELFELGRAAAVDWLDQKIEYVGHASSVRIEDHFL
jgi:NTE family protein